MHYTPLPLPVPVPHRPTDITSYFLDVDAKATAAEVSSLPIKVRGPRQRSPTEHAPA